MSRRVTTLDKPPLPALLAGARRRPRLLIGVVVVALAVLAGVGYLVVRSVTNGGTPATPPGNAGDPASPIVGAYANQPQATEASFDQLRSLVPGLRVRRSFAPGMPRSVDRTPAAQDASDGVTTFLSVKPNFRDPGRDDNKIASLARSLPTGSYLTAWHEPENNMTAAQYVAMFRNFYTVAKQANPSINVGNVYMTYQWGPGRVVTNPDDWWVGSQYTDFLATDTYMHPYEADSSGDPRPLGEDPAHLRWHEWAASKAKPLLVTELGVSQQFSDAQRARYLTDSWAWLKANHYRMLLFWNGSGTPPNGESWDFADGAANWPKTLAAARAIAADGNPSTLLH